MSAKKLSWERWSKLQDIDETSGWAGTAEVGGSQWLISYHFGERELLS